MSGLDFPSSPSNGDTFEQYVYDGIKAVWRLSPEAPNSNLDNLNDVTITSATDGQALVFDSATGNWINGDTAGGVEIASTAPSSPSAGDLWWDSDNGNLYVYYDDGTSQQWVSASDGQATISDTAPAGYNGQLWWNSTEGKMYVYYDDGTSAQWVAAGGPQVTVQATAPAGYQGQMWLDSTDGSMYVYYTDPGGASSSWIGAVSRSGGILQVVSTTKTDTYSASVASGGFSGDITGLTASITPRSTSSKIFVLVSLNVDTADTGGAALYRDGTKIGAGNSAGSRASVSVGGLPNLSTITNYDQPISHLDSPSTTSSITYSVRLWSKETTTQTLYVNRSSTDSDTALFARYSSTITLIEVAG